MSERLVVSVMLLGLACRPVVPLGSDDEQIVDGDCGVVAPIASCPAGSYGVAVQFGTEAEVRSRVVGRWAFCGGQRRYTGRGAMEGFYGGTGVEFWEEAGALRFAFLQGASFVRRDSADAVGAVRLEVNGGKARATLVPADGIEAPWALDVFVDQPVLRNSAFDVWEFVAVP